MCSFFAGKLKTGDPSAKRRKLDPEGNAEEEEEEEEEEMEEGGGLFEIPAQPQGTSVPVKPPLTEAMETEKKMAMMRSGKTVEERQEEFKEMLLERGVRDMSCACTHSHVAVCEMYYSMYTCV